MMLPVRLSMLALSLSMVLAAGAHAQKGVPLVKGGVAVDTVMAPVKPSAADAARERRWREETATLAGTIRDAETGLPLRANVIPELGWEFTDSLGHYTVEGQEPGRQTVRIERRGFVGERRTVELAAGQTTTLDVSLRRAEPPCCALTGAWRVRFVLPRRGGQGPAPADSVVEGLLTFADSIPNPLGNRFAPLPNVRREYGLSDIDFTPFFGGRIARDVSTTVMGPTGGNFTRETVAEVFSGDSVEITLIPRISHGGVSMEGRVRDGVVRGKWQQRAYALGAVGTFEMRREGPGQD
jgi:hypothetical protein